MTPAILALTEAPSPLHSYAGTWNKPSRGWPSLQLSSPTFSLWQSKAQTLLGERRIRRRTEVICKILCLKSDSLSKCAHFVLQQDILRSSIFYLKFCTVIYSKEYYPPHSVLSSCQNSLIIKSYWAWLFPDHSLRSSCSRVSSESFLNNKIEKKMKWKRIQLRFSSWIILNNSEV